VATVDKVLRKMCFGGNEVMKVSVLDPIVSEVARDDVFNTPAVCAECSRMDRQRSPTVFVLGFGHNLKGLSVNF
jgi:hypothetical protein